MATGATVRLTGSGLGCEHWPGCQPHHFEPKSYHSYIEFSNRVIAFFTIVVTLATFDGADSPLELQNFAVARLGQGAVARALDNSAITPPAYVDSLAELARARGIALQIGTTNGGNDGSTFTQFGVVDVAMGWPLRYSHSPAEVVDLKDLLSLADMVRAVAEDW